MRTNYLPVWPPFMIYLRKMLFSLCQYYLYAVQLCAMDFEFYLRRKYYLVSVVTCLGWPVGWKALLNVLTYDKCFLLVKCGQLSLPTNEC